MPSRNKPLSFTPTDGGQLFSRRSHEQAGFKNYVIKRDWRRDLDQEIRAEGHVYFQTNFDETGDQPYPQRQNDAETFNPITLLHQARRPNGETAVIAGTPSTLYRHYASGNDGYIEDGDDGPYALDDYTLTDYWTDSGDPLYVEPDYIADEDGSWVIIGDNFTTDTARWEGVNINGWAIFNNATELPVTYRVENGDVFPNYEMREAGIAKVGTIAEFNGILIAGDVSVFKDGKLATLMAHEDSGSVQARQHGSYISTPFTAEKSTIGTNLSYDGTNDTVTVPFAASLAFTSTFTLEFWVKYSSWSGAGGSRDMLAYRTGAPFHEVKFGLKRTIDDGPINVFFNRNSAVFGSDVISTDSIAPNTWTHIAVTTASGGSILYVNGVASGSFAGHSSAQASANGWAIGLGGYLGPAFQLSEVRFWSVQRTAQQILDNLTLDVTGQTGLQGYWKLNDGSGLTAADSSGNANNGTLVNGPAWVSSDSPVDSYIKISPIAAITNGLTHAGATATFTAVSPHKLTSGQLVKVSGAADALYNGLVTATVIDSLTFTYPLVGAPTTPDVGSPVVQRALFGTASFDYDGIVGKDIFLLNGFRATIDDVVDPVTVRVNRSTSTLTTAALFQIVNDTNSEALTGTVAKNGTTTVTGSSTLFTDELWPGASILIPGGANGDEIRIVQAIASDTSLTVTSAFAATTSGQTGLLMSDYLLISESSYFTPEMEGRNLFFDDLHYRKVVDYLNPKYVVTNSNLAVASQGFKLENVSAYDAVTDASYYDRIQYRRVWSDIDQPLRFSSSVPASMVAGSRVVELAYQARSFVAGDTVLVLGAGTAGGNLTSTIIWVHPNHTTFYLDDAAVTTTVNGEIAQAGAATSVSGFDDLQDDGSAIIKMLELTGVLVTYKDTAIYLTRYTGNAAEPFVNERVYQDNGRRTIFYRNSLTKAGKSSHIFAGRDEFYEFNLVTREPTIFKPFVACSDWFYSQATLDNTNLIFAAENQLTQELCFCFPSTGEDKALIYDEKWGTQRTTGAAFTAMATVKKPLSGIAIGVQQEWCLLGTADGIVMRYGLASIPQDEWGGRKAQYSRLGSGYESRLKSGLIGDRFYETTMTEWMGEPATQDYPTVTQFTFNLYGWRNPSEQPPKSLISKLITVPNMSPLVPMFYRRHFFQDEIVITGTNNPLRLCARTVAISKIGSRGQQRAGQQP